MSQKAPLTIWIVEQIPAAEPRLQAETQKLMLQRQRKPTVVESNKKARVMNLNKIKTIKCPCLQFFNSFFFLSFLNLQRRNI